MEIKNKVIVITGGSKGFGRALAEAFVKEGSKVVICGLSKEDLSKTVKEIGVLGIVADVRNENDMQKLADKAIEKYGNIDIWINNAGIWVSGQNAEDFDMSKVKDMFDINILGLINGSRVALKYMKGKDSGTIINVLSTSALVGRPKSSMYATTKWGANGFTKSIREENKENNISILSVFPGGMKTKIFGDYKYPDFDQFMDTNDVAGKVVSNLKKENPELELIIKRENA